jgi:phosphate transport system protein
MIIDGPLVNLLVDIHRMATKTQSMLHRALEAFAQQDLALAQAIPAEDAEVDALYNRVYRNLLAFIRDNSQARGNSQVLVNQARYLARIARNLERAADQVPHICGWVAFALTGEMDGDADATALAGPETNTTLSDSESGKEENVLVKQGDPQ